MDKKPSYADAVYARGWKNARQPKEGPTTQDFPELEEPMLRLTDKWPKKEAVVSQEVKEPEIMGLEPKDSGEAEEGVKSTGENQLSDLDFDFPELGTVPNYSKEDLELLKAEEEWMLRRHELCKQLQD